MCSYFDVLWQLFKANFGVPPPISKIDTFQSYKTVIFTSLTGGLVIWITYRAYITSLLSISYVKHPFHDLDSLSKTNYL